MSYIEMHQGLQVSVQRVLQRLKDEDIPKAEAMLASELQKAEALSSSPE